MQSNRRIFITVPSLSQLVVAGHEWGHGNWKSMYVAGATHSQRRSTWANRGGHALPVASGTCRYGVARRRVDRGALVHLAPEYFQVAMEEKNVSVHVDGTCTIREDRNMIPRVILNLLSNAIRDLPARGVTQVT